MGFFSKLFGKKSDETKYDITLVSYDMNNKLPVIKEIRETTCLGLKEAKDLSESTPTIIVKDKSFAEANKIKENFKKFGAVIQLTPSNVEKSNETKYDITLVSYDMNSKVLVIKEIRVTTGLGLKEAKDLSESTPSIIAKDKSFDEANKIKANFEKLGAFIQLTPSN